MDVETIVVTQKYIRDQIPAVCLKLNRKFEYARITLDYFKTGSMNRTYAYKHIMLNPAIFKI